MPANARTGVRAVRSGADACSRMRKRCGTEPLDQTEKTNDAIFEREQRWMFLSDGRMLAGWCGVSGRSRGSVRVCIHLQRGQRLSYLFALGEGRSPVAVVAGTVETQSLAYEQCVGDQGDGQFGDRLQGAVGAGEGEFKSRFGHSFLRELARPERL